MFNIRPFRKRHLNMKDDFSSPSIKKFFNNNFFSVMDYIKEDLEETDKNYFIKLKLPDIKKEAVDIEFSNSYLIISVKRDEAIKEERQNYIRSERHYGEFRKSFYVGNIDASKIEASFKNETLEVFVPKITSVKNRKRKIHIN
ncbi:Hsp20 family protein [Dethiothermospora halolimnae]|uniref:Hsp20 family protein n=1 Tax=Dethiothermospora halolimnae TaxID=3114390 RepID=UPI003CCBF6DA